MFFDSILQYKALATTTSWGFLAVLFSFQIRFSAADRSHCLFKNLFQTLLSQCRAFHIFVGFNLFAHLKSLFESNGNLTFWSKSFECFWILSQVRLCANENNRSGRAMVWHFGVPFCTNIFEGVGVNNGEADQKHIRVRVWQRSQSKNK